MAKNVEGLEEKKEFPPALKYILIGVVGLTTVGLVFWLSIKFGVNPPFEIVGGAIAFGFLIWAVSNKFEDKMKFAKGTLIFISICLFANVFYLATLWTEEKVHNDETLWSPSIIAIVFFAIAVWFAHWFKGSPRKIIITTLSLLLANLFFVITAMINGDEAGVRLIFVLVFFGELVLAWGADKSFNKFSSYNARRNINKFSGYFFLVVYAESFASFVVEMIAVPITAVSKWPLTNWQTVTAVVSSLTACYLIYAVWGRKYL